MTEKQYIERDAMIAYILDEVNPARKNAGLSEIREEEARECYRIINDFRNKWDNSRHKEKS